MILEGLRNFGGFPRYATAPDSGSKVGILVSVETFLVAMTAITSENVSSLARVL